MQFLRLNPKLIFNLIYTFNQVIVLVYALFQLLNTISSQAARCNHTDAAAAQCKNAADNSYDSSALDLWKKEKQDKKRVLRLLVCLPEEKCPADELEIILKEIFEIDENALTNKLDWTPSDVKRLIRLYDYVRWGKKKDPET